MWPWWSSKRCTLNSRTFPKVIIPTYESLSHLCPHFALSFFLILAVLMGVYWYLFMVLICISVACNAVGHFCLWLLAICLFSFIKFLFKYFTYFLKCGFFVCPLLLSTRILLVFWTKISYLDYKYIILI